MKRIVTACLPWLILGSAHAQSGWSTPTLEPVLNSTASDSSPDLSADGMTLYLSSFRGGNWEIYESQRPLRSAPWSVPVPVSAVSDPAAVDFEPFLTADGLELWFTSSRSGGMGSFDILRVTRPNTTSSWGAPTFVTELNSVDAEAAPSLTDDGLEVYFLTTGWGAPSAPNNAIFRATRTNVSQPFGTPQPVVELATPNTHRDVEVSGDGLAIVWTEYDPTIRTLEVWIAERLDRASPFSNARTIPALLPAGSARGVNNATLSADRNEVFLAVDFGTAGGSQEILSARYDGLTHSGIASTTSTMQLHYRDGTALGLPYVLALALGNGGFPIGTRHVALDPDSLFWLTLGTDLPGISTGFFGTLDGNGEALATLVNPSPLLQGLHVYAGGFTLDVTAPLGVRTIADSFELLLQ